ncbi:MAG: hypothetical protein RBU37_20355 [Myxococcota bacterium]|nr:hypothetical protein [Myxococcota bacterium]
MEARRRPRLWLAPLCLLFFACSPSEKPDGSPAAVSSTPAQQNPSNSPPAESVRQATPEATQAPEQTPQLPTQVDAKPTAGGAQEPPAPLSPANWKLPAFLLPSAAIDPRLLLQTNWQHHSPLPTPCRLSCTKADGELKWSLEQRLDEARAPVELQRHDQAGDSVTKTSYKRDAKGKLLGWSSSGDDGDSTATLSYSGERLDKVDLNGAGCRRFEYDSEGRLALVYESDSDCKSIDNIVAYDYEQGSLPTRQRFCSDKSLSTCSVEAQPIFDDRGVLVKLQVRDDDMGNQELEFEYDNRGLLSLVRESRDGSTATERFVYDDSGSHLLSWTRERGSKRDVYSLEYDCPPDP